MAKRLINTRMKVVFGVSGRVRRSLAKGQVLTMVVEALDSRQLAGTISRIAPSADPRSRLFDVELTLPNRDGALQPGMIAKLVWIDAITQRPAIR